MEKVSSAGQIPTEYDKNKFESLLKRFENAINTLVTDQNHQVTLLETSRQVTVGDSMVVVDASASAVTVTLPLAKDANQKRMAFKKLDPGGNQVIVTGNGSETIDGANTSTLSVQYSTLEIVSNGSTWYKY
jgi:hypothetical protein